MEYLTVEEVSAHFGVPVSTVRRWCADKTIDASKHGRQWLVDRDKLPSTAPRRRRAGTTRTRGTSVAPAGYDVSTALAHVRSTDLGELWVPDVVRHYDIQSDTNILARVAQRLADSRFDTPVEVPIPKTPFFTRSAVLLGLEDRIAFQALVASFGAKIESRTSNSVFSARVPKKTGKRFFELKGTDAWLRWRAAVRDEIVRGDVWVMKTDLTAYFDTISHDLLVSQVHSLNVPGQTVGLLRTMLRTWAIVPGQGLPQGPNASRLLGNLFLLPVDREMVDAGYRYYRYLDDIRIVTDSKADAIAAMRLFERECRLRGLLVSSSKTELLYGRVAQADVSEDKRRGDAQYLMSSGQLPKARKELRRILRDSLRDDGHIDVRSSRFAFWRLAQLRESSVLPVTLQHLEDLAPVARVAMAYLRPFIARKNVETGISHYLQDQARAASPFMLSWVFALLLDHPGPLPDAWISASRRIGRDKNWPNYVRALAINVTARGVEPSDISWIQSEVRREFDPSLLRGYTVALFRAGALDKNERKHMRAKAPELGSLLDYLNGRTTLPSLVEGGTWNPVGR